MSTALTERRTRIGREHGVAAVWATAWMLVFALVGGVGLVLGFAVARQHQVDAAADLTSLAAAAQLQGGGDACRSARLVAAANLVTLTDCRVVGDDVLVRVRAHLELPFGLRPWVGAAARAGPA